MPSIRDEISDNTLWRSCLGELLGTCLLVIVGCGSCISGWDDAYKPTIVQIALAFGLIVATMVWCLAHISGGHINPAVTIAMLLTRKISVVKALLYMIAQCLGAILGAGILLGVTPALNRGALGVTMLHPNINQYQGFGVEFCVTFVLVFCVFATCDGQRSDIHGSRALSIGLSVTVCHLFAVSKTTVILIKFIAYYIFLIYFCLILIKESVLQYYEVCMLNALLKNYEGIFHIFPDQVYRFQYEPRP